MKGAAITGTPAASAACTRVTCLALPACMPRVHPCSVTPMAHPTAGSSRSLIAAAFAAFAAFGAFWGVWGASVPRVQDRADVTNGQLGLALLFVGAGALPAMLLVGRALDRWGLRVAALVLGALGVIGAGLALLFAPQSGKRTRRDIAHISRKAKEQAVDAVEEFSETVHDMVDSVSDKAAELLDKGKELTYSAKKDVLKAIGEVQGKLETEKSRLAKLLG